MVNNPNFEPYLRSLTHHYFEWREFYTSTEAIQLTVQVAQSEAEDQPPKLQKKIERWSVLEGIRKYAATHVLLSGRPGSGKSTVLRRLLLEEAERSLQEFQTIPVLVELRSGKPILKLIESTFRQHRLRISVEQIDELLFEGKLLLLLDGVNEIPTDELLVQVEEFRSDNLSTPMIFTTRDLGMGGDLRIEKKLMMEPLNSEQMQQFVGKYLPSEQGESLLQQLGDRLKELGETPLLLKMLCDVFKLRQEIPKSKGELFRWVDREYDCLKGMTTLAPELRHWQTELLQQLAFEMMRGNNSTKLDLTISRTDAIAIFEAFLQEHGVTDFGQKARVWLEDLQRYHLLQLSADHKIEFHHQLFQEYYAAEYLLQRLLSLSDVTLQQEYLNYLKWTETLALMSELVEDEGQALRVVELAIGVDLMLGARLAGAVKQGVQEKTVRNVLDLKVPQLLKFQLLGATHSSVAVPELMNVLQIEEDVYQKHDAAFALRVLGSKAAVPALMNALTHENEITIATAAFALGALGDYSAIPSLLDMLNHSNHHVMRNAVSSLGELRAKDAVSKLIEKLGNEPYVIKDTIDALGEIGDEDAIPELIKTVLNSNHLLSGYASKALKKINSEKASKDLLGFLKENNSRIADKAAEALGEIGCESAVKALFNALNDGYVGWASAEALKKIGGSEAISALLEALQSRNPSACGWAIHALGELGDPIAVEGLIGVLTHWDFSVVEEAVEALGKIGDKTVIPPLLRFLQDDEHKTRRPEIYQKAVIALGKLGSNSAKPELLKILKDQSPYIRPWIWAEICDALEKLGGEDVVISFLKVLKSASDSNLRRLSTQGLGNLGDRAAVEELLKALKDKDSSVQLQAAKALGKISSQEIVPRLFRFLEDENPKNREAAIKALEEIHDEEIVPKLLEILEKEEPDIRYHVIKALKEIGSGTALDKLQELQKIMDDNFVYAIASIQARCQFYNYEIYQSLSELEAMPRPSVQPTPSIQYDIKAEVVQIIECNPGEVIGKRDHKAV